MEIQEFLQTSKTLFLNNKYSDWYFQIILNAFNKNRKKGDGNYYEYHHIFPKSIFPQFKGMRGNRVLLTAREHFICHYLLIKCFDRHDMIKKMKHAAWWMSNRTDDINSKLYSKLKMEISSIRKRPHSIETINKRKNSQTGKKWIYLLDTKEEKSVNVEDLFKYENYIFGRNPENKTGGYPKGKSKSEESKLKASETMKKTLLSTETHWNLGKKHSEDSKELRSKRQSNMMWIFLIDENRETLIQKDDIISYENYRIGRKSGAKRNRK